MRGVLVMTRNLDSALVEGLKKRTLLSVALDPASSPSLPPDVRDALQALGSSQEQVHVQSLNQMSVAGYFVLRDIHGLEGSSVACGNAPISLPARTHQFALLVANALYCQRRVRIDYIAPATANRAGSIDLPERRGGTNWGRQVQRSFRANPGTRK